MSKNEYHYTVNAFVVWVWTSFTVLSLFLGISWYQEDRAEKEKIANMSSTEYVVYQETLAAEAALQQQQQAEAAAAEAEATAAFEAQMHAYENEDVHYLGGQRGSQAEFQLTNVAIGERSYVFDTDLPAGREAFLDMSGRGSVGIGGASDAVADWQRAGNYGIYHFESAHVYSVSPGDFLQFENLSSVTITILF